MKKIRLIRPNYPLEVNVLVISLIFLITFICSHEIFGVSFHQLESRKSVYLGMFLVGVAAILVTLILWEEILFPIKIKQYEDGIRVSNHQRKLRTQVFMYLGIPAIFGFIYYNYNVNHFHFLVWFGLCILIPVVIKIFSGIKNYRDFLTLTHRKIEYKNNEKEGSFDVADVRSIRIKRDEGGVLSKIILQMNTGEVTIDVDEMELEEFYDIICEYISEHYRLLVK